MLTEKFDFRLTVWYNFKAKSVNRRLMESGVWAQEHQETGRVA